MTKTTAVYVRISSSSQDMASQLSDLQQWAKSQENVKFYKDTASGKTMSRPAMDKLLADIAVGEVAKIAVWRLDRLGRTAKGLTTFFDDLVQRGIGLVSLKDGLDLSTPAGRLMANVLASVAAYETEVRSERQRAGITAARAAGKVWGGSEKGRFISVTPEQAATIKKLKNEGMKVAKIARAVGVSRPTVYRILAA